MRIDVLYKAIDPYYSDCEQSFIGATSESCWNQKFEFEEWLGREHPAGIKTIYKVKILKDTTDGF